MVNLDILQNFFDSMYPSPRQFLGPQDPFDLKPKKQSSSQSVNSAKDKHLLLLTTKLRHGSCHTLQRAWHANCCQKVNCGLQALSTQPICPCWPWAIMVGLEQTCDVVRHVTTQRKKVLEILSCLHHLISSLSHHWGLIENDGGLPQQYTQYTIPMKTSRVESWIQGIHPIPCPWCGCPSVAVCNMCNMGSRCWNPKKSALLARATIHVPIPQTPKLRSKLHQNNFAMLPLCCFHELASFHDLPNVTMRFCGPVLLHLVGLVTSLTRPRPQSFFFTSFETAPKGRNGSAHQVPWFLPFSEARIGHHKALRHHGRLHGHSTWNIICWCEMLGFFWRNGLPHLAHLVHPCWDRLVAGPCKLRSAKKAGAQRLLARNSEEVYWNGWYTNVNPVVYCNKPGYF